MHSMNIYINGSAIEVESAITVTQLIEYLKLTGKRIAIEVNQEIIPRSQHNETILSENDQLEIVHAIGGG